MSRIMFCFHIKSNILLFYERLAMRYLINDNFRNYRKHHADSILIL